VENDVKEKIEFPKRRICLSVKILIVAFILLILLLIAQLISVYINVNSGGLNAFSGILFNLCLPISGVFFLLLIILIPICFIVSLIKINNPANLVLTIITTIILILLPYCNSYLWNKIKRSPGPDLSRGLGINLERYKRLKELEIKLNHLKNDKDFIFTEQFLDPNRIIDISNLPNGKFILNSNLINQKPSQIPNDVVVIFESNLPREKGYIGGPNDISTWWHYGRGSLMVFGDGHVDFAKTEDFNNLRWKP
jgi:heme/copper-type cytochrome/quinol oxidase subunit 2